VYPLPAVIPDTKALSNGVSSGTDPNSVSCGANTQNITSLGSDESLGGALLTPIPWLRTQNPSAASNGNGGDHGRNMEGEVKTESTETIDGPNGAGSIETVSVSVNGISSTTLATANRDSGTGLRAEGGVTQGELLRQEQRAGVVPATQLENARPLDDREGNKNDDDETPHARGPEDIGMQDMGPQVAGSVGVMHGIDVEAAVGRRSEESEVVLSPPTTPKREASDEMERESKRVKEESSVKTPKSSEDDNMVLVDADGRTEDEPKVGEKGENIGADAIDTSTV
jgi:hypothetical protein